MSRMTFAASSKQGALRMASGFAFEPGSSIPPDASFAIGITMHPLGDWIATINWQSGKPAEAFDAGAVEFLEATERMTRA